MKNKLFLTEADRKQILANKEKIILENFAKTFNKIKRIDENEINGDTSPNVITVKFNGDGFMQQYWDGTEGDKVYQAHGFASNLKNLQDKGYSNYGHGGLRMRKGYYYPLFKAFPKGEHKNSIWYYIAYSGDEINIYQSSEHSDIGYDILNYFDSLKNITHNWYCKFEDGIAPGAIDHRGYFKIVSVN